MLPPVPDRPPRVPDVLAVLADFGDRAAVAAYTDLAAEVADRVQLERSRVLLIDRLRAGSGGELQIDVGPSLIRGRLSAVVADAVLVTAADREFVIPLWSVLGIVALPARSVSPQLVSPIDLRLGFGSLLRRRLGRSAAVVRSDGRSFRGELRRVGADHLDLVDVSRPVTDFEGSRVIPYAAVSVVELD